MTLSASARPRGFASESTARSLCATMAAFAGPSYAVTAKGRERPSGRGVGQAAYGSRCSSPPQPEAQDRTWSGASDAHAAEEEVDGRGGELSGFGHPPSLREPGAAASLRAFGCG